MRLALSGGIPQGKYLAFKLEDGTTFMPRVFEEHGYVNFDLLCVGGAGGNGGSWHNRFGGIPYRAMGGAGGGGGSYRVTGLLRALPDECPVQVGKGGAYGTSGTGPSFVANGEDGGTSSFNDNTCYASGGKGGHAPSFPYTENIFVAYPPTPSGAGGGQGGVGGRSTPGGGANGGATNPYPNEGYHDPTPGLNGWWNPNAVVDETGGSLGVSLGAGGGGGAGGIGEALDWNLDGFGNYRTWSVDDIWLRPWWWITGAKMLCPGSPGGIGAYGAVNEDWWSCPGGGSARDNLLGAYILPGGAGGANALEILELPLMAGRSFGETRNGEDGIVVIAVSFPDSD